MSGPPTTGSSGLTRLEVVICDTRAFDRRALAAILGNDPRLHVGVTTEDPVTLVDELGPPGMRGAVVILGSRILREHPGLVNHVRLTQPGARVLVVGVDEPSLRRLVEACGLDGYVRRNGEIEAISRTVRGFDT